MMKALGTDIGTIHFVGIGGIGMSGIAEVMHQLGYKVQGSDASDSYVVENLRKAGIPVTIGHSRDNLGDAAVVEANFTPEMLARQVEALSMDPEALSNAAARALSVGRPHAARDLADLVERIGNGIAPVAVGPALTPRVTAGAPNGAMPA